jgi:hypothetical protein
MTKPSSPRKRLIYFFIFSLLFFLLMPVVVLYSAGYRLGTGLSLEPTGGVYVYYPESGVYVSINDLPPERTAIFTKSIFIPDLKPGRYDLVAIKEGYTNWRFPKEE